MQGLLLKPVFKIGKASGIAYNKQLADSSTFHPKKLFTFFSIKTLVPLDVFTISSLAFRGASKGPLASRLIL